MSEEIDEETLQGLRERFARAQEAERAEAQKMALLKVLLAPDAYERIMNVRIANYEMYDQVVGLLAYLYRQKKLRGKVSNEQLYKLLSQISSAKKQGSISVKRK